MDSTRSRPNTFEEWLQSAADATPYPPTPPIVGAVAVRLVQVAAQRSDFWSRVFGSHTRSGTLRPALSALVLAIVALGLTFAISSDVRSAFAKLFGLQHIEVVPVEGSLPVPDAASFGFELVAGLTTLDEARARAVFPVLVPTGVEGLGEPDAVFFQDLEPGQQVILVYGSRPDIGKVPEDGESLFTLFQFQTEGVFQKQIYPETLIEELEVAGLRMLWFEGAAHILMYRNPDGTERVEFERVVNRNTLAWELDDVTFRIETVLPKEGAVAIAIAVVEAAESSSSRIPDPRIDGTETPDPDALALANLSGRVVKWVRDGITPTAELRQLDIVDSSGRHIFRLVDTVAQVNVTVLMESPNDPPQQWEIHHTTGASKLDHSLGIDYDALRVGLKALEMIGTEYYGSGYELLGIMLFAGEDGGPYWRLSCDNPYGVCGFVDGISGRFTPPEASPGGPPPRPMIAPTASPVP